MILESILTMIGGTAFRLVAGKAMEIWEANSEHKREKERMAVQADLEDRAAERRLKAFQEAKALGISEIRAKQDATVAELQEMGFLKAIDGVNNTVNMITPTGKWWIDILPVVIGCWNQAIRPALASFSIFVWANSVYVRNYNLNDWDLALIAGILGIFIGDRIDRKSKGQ